jgi:hypothetical protein
MLFENAIAGYLILRSERLAAFEAFGWFHDSCFVAIGSRLEFPGFAVVAFDSHGIMLPGMS